MVLVDAVRNAVAARIPIALASAALFESLLQQVLGTKSAVVAPVPFAFLPEGDSARSGAVAAVGQPAMRVVRQGERRPRCCFPIEQSRRWPCWWRREFEEGGTEAVTGKGTQRLPAQRGETLGTTAAGQLEADWPHSAVAAVAAVEPAPAESVALAEPVHFPPVAAADAAVPADVVAPIAFAAAASSAAAWARTSAVALVWGAGTAEWAAVAATAALPAVTAAVEMPAQPAAAGVGAAASAKTQHWEWSQAKERQSDVLWNKDNKKTIRWKSTVTNVIWLRCCMQYL